MAHHARLRMASRAAAILLGAWFLLTGAAKALDPIGFASVIEEYGILAGALSTRLLAWGLIAAEFTLGACVLLGIARRPALLLAGALLGVFTATTARAWAGGAVHDCGCFGPLLERTPGQTLVQDLVLLGVLGLALMPGSAVPAHPGRRRLVLALVAAAAGLAAPPAVAWLAPALAEGRTVAAIGLEAHLPWDPPDPALYTFLEPLQLGPAAAALEDLSKRGVSVIALSSASSEQIETFRWSAGPSYEILNVPRKLLRQLSQDDGGAFLVQQGRVTRVWRGRPPGSEGFSGGS